MDTGHGVNSNEKCQDAALRIWRKICAMPAMAKKGVMEVSA